MNIKYFSQISEQEFFEKKYYCKIKWLFNMKKTQFYFAIDEGINIDITIKNFHETFSTGGKKVKVLGG